MEELGDPTDSENEGEGEGEEEAEAEEEAEDEGEDEESDSGNTPIKLQINLTTEVEKEVDCFLESQEEQFTFEEFYCMLGPWALGRQKEVLAALKRLVNGYSVSPAKLIVWTTTTRAWTWTSSCSDPILSAVSSSATRTTSRGVIRRGEVAWCL